MLTSSHLIAALLDLLTGRKQPEVDGQLPGAELVVTDGGTEVFRAALARHARLEHEGLIWIRPVLPGGRDPDSQLPVFDPVVARRRALQISSAELTDAGLDLELVTGQHASIQPAQGDQLAILQDFDTWMATLPADERRDLEGLRHD
ncbi:hypothetical protein [Amycolatopsis sp. NPDC059657]|uniref:hypothetical protein n=1 Tax=Amycolatopsis sp. NPDC059657 TaxID=3346899 RepID=UPI003670C383